MKKITLSYGNGCFAKMHQLFIPILLSGFALLFSYQGLGQFIGSAPSRNGAIGANEYGDHTNGRNAWSDGGRTWYMTWDDTNLYIAVANNGNAGGDELVMYIDTDPQTTPNTGNGALGGIGDFDGVNYGRLPFRAEFATFIRNGYHQHRINSGVDWGGANNDNGSIAKTTLGNLQEIQIAWSLITGSGRPSAFNFFFYLNGTDPYGGLSNFSADNDFSSKVNLTGRQFFNVASTENGSSTFPFSRRIFINQRALETINNYGNNFYGIVNADNQTLELNNSITVANFIRNEVSCVIRNTNTGGATITMNGGSAGSITNLGTLEADYLPGSGRIMNYSIEGANTDIAINSTNVDVFNFIIRNGAKTTIGAGNILRTGNTGTIRVESGGTIEFVSTGLASEWAGVSSFELQSGGNLITSNADGILSTGTTGSIRTDNRTYSSGANYEFKGGNTTLNAFTTTPTAATINNLTINVSGTTNITGWSPSVSGTLSLSSGILGIGSNTLTVVNGISGNGSLAGTTASNLYLYGGNSTLRFESGSRNLSLLWVEGYATMVTDLVVNFQLYIRPIASSLSINGNTLRVNGGFTSNGPLVGSTSSNLILGGSTNIYFQNAGTDNYLKDLTLENDALITLVTPLNITGGSAPGTVSISGTAQLFSNGNLTLKSNNSGTASLAQITSAANPAIVGEVTVERYIPQTPNGTGRAWRLLTIPVTSSTTDIMEAWAASPDRVSQLLPGNVPDPVQTPGVGTIITGHAFSTAGAANLAGYDWWGALWNGTAGSESSIKRFRPIALRGNTDGDWPSNTALRTVIKTKLNATDQAYMLFVRGDRTVAVGGGSTTLAPKGNVRTGDVSFTVPATTAKYFTYGNPYPSSIDFAALYQDNSSVIKQVLRVWDARIPGTHGLGAWRTIIWNGSAWADNISGPQPNVQYIHSSQGVMLEYNTAAGGNITTKETHKVNGTPFIAPFAAVSNQSQQLLVRLNQVNANGSLVLVDGTSAYFSEAYVAGSTDRMDIGKMESITGTLGIAFRTEGKLLTFEGRPLVQNNDKLWLNITGIGQQTYAFEMEAVNIARPGLSAWLVDKYKATETPVSLNGETVLVQFTADAEVASRAADRFEIVFKQAPANQIVLNGVVQGKDINLSWNTAFEDNVKHYEIEYSINRVRYRRLAQVNAKNESPANYSWLHKTPGTGTHAYRVRGVTNDGKAFVSNDLIIGMNNGNALFTVTPNPIPASNPRVNLNFTGFAAGSLRVILINMGTTARLAVNRISHNGSNYASYPFQLPPNLMPGLYYLNVTSLEGSFVQPILVQ